MDPLPPAALQNEIPRSISREDMAKLPIRRYEGRVCLVATREDLEEAGADLEQESLAGFDTETRPAFRKGESHLPALVQVATAPRSSRSRPRARYTSSSCAAPRFTRCSPGSSPNPAPSRPASP